MGGRSRKRNHYYVLTLAWNKMCPKTWVCSPILQMNFSPFLCSYWGKQRRNGKLWRGGKKISLKRAPSVLKWNCSLISRQKQGSQGHRNVPGGGVRWTVWVKVSKARRKRWLNHAILSLAFRNVGNWTLFFFCYAKKKKKGSITKWFLYFCFLLHLLSSLQFLFASIWLSAGLGSERPECWRQGTSSTCDQQPEQLTSLGREDAAEACI